MISVFELTTRDVLAAAVIGLRAGIETGQGDPAFGSLVQARTGRHR